ncbi:MAG: GerMN domain-containing protein [Caldisericaceae bacterium]
MKIEDLTTKKKKHTSSLVAVVFVLLFILSSVSIYVAVKSRSDSSRKLIDIYYYDPIVHELVPSKQYVSGATQSLLILNVFDKMLNPPDNSLFSVIPQGVQLLSSNVSDGTCFINLKVDTSLLRKFSLYSEYAAVYGIANTLTEIDGIDSVKFALNGQNASVFANFVSIEKPVSHYNGAFPKTTKVNLFFPTPDFKMLVVEQREIIYEQDPTKNCESILHELFRGSYYGLPNLYQNVNCISFSIKSGGVALVDLSDTVLKNPLGSHLEKLFVEAIVDTLTEVPDVQSVQIEVGGHILDSLFGSVSIDAPIGRFLANGSKILVPYYLFELDDNEFYAPLPTPCKDYNIDTLFALLKTPSDSSIATKISKSAKITDKSITNGLLNLTIDLGLVPSAGDLEIIKRQVALSFTEIPGIYSVNLHIGEESFILGR